MLKVAKEKEGRRVVKGGKEDKWSAPTVLPALTIKHCLVSCCRQTFMELCEICKIPATSFYSCIICRGHNELIIIIIIILMCSFRQPVLAFLKLLDLDMFWGYFIFWVYFWCCMSF